MHREQFQVRPALLVIFLLVLALGLPPLGDRDAWYNENRIWWVGAALFLSLGVILVVEIFDWLVLEWRRWRHRTPPPPPVDPGETFHLRENERPLRERHFQRVRPLRRTFGEGRTDADPESER